MDLIKIACPSCGGSVSFGDKEDTVICDFCNNKMIIKQEVEKLQEEHKDEIQAIVDRIYDLIASSKFIMAQQAAYDGLKIVPYSGRLHLCLLLCELNLNHPDKLATYPHDYGKSENFFHCLRYMTTEDRNDLLYLAGKNPNVKIENVEAYVPKEETPEHSDHHENPQVTQNTTLGVGLSAPQNASSGGGLSTPQNTSGKLSGMGGAPTNHNSPEGIAKRKKMYSIKPGVYVGMVALPLLSLGLIIAGVLSWGEIATIIGAIFMFAGCATAVCMVMEYLKQKKIKICPHCKDVYDYTDDVGYELINSEIKTHQYKANSTSDPNKVVKEERIDTYRFTCVCSNCGQEHTFTQKYKSAVLYYGGRLQEYSFADYVKRQFTNKSLMLTTKIENIIGFISGGVALLLSLIFIIISAVAVGSKRSFVGTYYGLNVNKYVTVCVDVTEDTMTVELSNGLYTQSSESYDYEYMSASQFKKTIQGKDALGDSAIIAKDGSEYKNAILWHTDSGYFLDGGIRAEMHSTPCDFSSLIDDPKNYYYEYTYGSNVVKLYPNGTADYILDGVQATGRSYMYVNNDWLKIHSSNREYDNYANAIVIVEKNGYGSKFTCYVFNFIDSKTLQTNGHTFIAGEATDNNSGSEETTPGGTTPGGTTPGGSEETTPGGTTPGGTTPGGTTPGGTTPGGTTPGGTTPGGTTPGGTTPGGTTPSGELQETVQSGHVTYELSDNKASYSVVGVDENATTIRIESKINGVPVTEVCEQAFANCTTLTSAVIPYSVKTIGVGAFFGCANLTTVELSNGLTTIGDMAFAVSGITSIEIPESVTTIGDMAFAASGITSIEIPESVTTIGGGVFAGCISLTKAILKGNIISLSTFNDVDDDGSPIIFGFFDSCTELDQVKLPATLKEIGDEAFVYCGISSIEIPESVTTIGDAAFAVSGITSIEIPDSVTTIGDMAFYGCINLTSIKIPFVGENKSQTGKTHFGYIFGADSCSDNISYVPESLKTVIISDVATSIDDFAFMDCCSLTSVTIGDKVTTIGAGAFSGCKSLEKLTVPFVGGSANATTPSASTLFGYIFDTEDPSSSSYYKASQGYSSEVYLRDYQLTSTVEYYLPVSLTEVTVTKGPILAGAFSELRLSKVILPTSLTEIPSLCFYACYLTSIDIPNNVTIIGNGAFAYCYELTDVVIGNEVEIIGEYAFNDCRELIGVTIPNSVTEISNYTFAYCYELTDVVIGNGVEIIGEDAFTNCDNLTDITIPDNVTEIGYGAFSGCSELASITIGSGVDVIGEFAFFIVSSKLKSVYYKGTSSRWQAINIGLNNYALTDAKRYYYSQTYKSGDYWHYNDTTGEVELWADQSRTAASIVALTAYEAILPSQREEVWAGK